MNPEQKVHLAHYLRTLSEDERREFLYQLFTKFHGPDEAIYAIKKWIVDHVKNPKVIIEAGAAEGRDTLLFNLIFEDTRIIAFEPMEVFYKQLLEMQRNYDMRNVTFVNLALAETDDRRTFYSMAHPSGPWGASTLLKPTSLHFENWKDIYVEKEVEVECTNLDTYCEQNGISEIDLLWLDMQGAEPTVLMSAPRALKHTKVLVSEVNFQKVYNNTILYPQYRKFLEANDFEIVQEFFPWPEQGDIIAVNTRYR